MDPSSISMFSVTNLQHLLPVHCEVLESQAVWTEVSGSTTFQVNKTDNVEWTSFHRGQDSIGSGCLRIVANMGTANTLYLPVRTGSGIPAYDFRFAGVRTKDPFLSFGVDVMDDQWYAIGIDLTGIELPNRMVEIEVYDRGQDPDQWISIGPPRAN